MAECDCRTRRNLWSTSRRDGRVTGQCLEGSCRNSVPNLQSSSSDSSTLVELLRQVERNASITPNWRRGHVPWISRDVAQKVGEGLQGSFRLLEGKRALRSKILNVQSANRDKSPKLAIEARIISFLCFSYLLIL